MEVAAIDQLNTVLPVLVPEITKRSSGISYYGSTCTANGDHAANPIFSTRLNDIKVHWSMEL